MQNQPHQAVMGDRDHILKEALVVRNPLLVQMKSSALKVQVKSSEYQDLKPCCAVYRLLKLTSTNKSTHCVYFHDNNSHCCGYQEQVILGNTLNPFTVIRNHIFLLHLNFLL